MMHRAYQHLKAFTKLSISISLILLCNSCQEVKNVPVSEKELLHISLSNEQLALLQSKKVLFGHQSVGDNIIDGIEQLMKHNPELKLNIKQVNSPADFSNPVFGHFPVGKNTDPTSKCDSFRDFMDSGVGNQVDIACFKFCFVDIDENTDIEDIFAYYVKTMEYLKNKYPGVTFIHITVPLTATPSGFVTIMKSLIKKILNKPDWVYMANVRRNKYNDMLRKTYLGKEPLYDLAAIESKRPDGRVQCFTYQGKTYGSMAIIYTDDGCHLNSPGRVMAAKALLDMLCSAH